MILDGMSCIAILVSAIVLLVALHNVMKYTRNIKTLGNKALVCSFYFLTILQSLLVITHEVLNLSSQGKFIYVICHEGSDSTYSII